MASSEPKPSGLIESVKRVGESILALLHNRLQLFSVELQEEKYRALQALLWLSAGLALLFLGIAMAVGTVAVLVWSHWGVAGLAALTLLLLAAAAIVLNLMWKRLKANGMPFSGTLQELKKDGEWLHRKS